MSAQSEWNKAHPEAMRSAARRYAANHPEKVRAWQKAGNARRRKEMVAFLTVYKLLSGCVDCGYRDNPDALQFDHIRDKHRLIGSFSSVRSCLPELRKCEVRCANCHALVTASRRRNP